MTDQELREQLAAVEASRRDWAAEALRLDAALVELAEKCEELSAKADAKIGEICGADLLWSAWGKAAQWMRQARNQPDPVSRPVCAGHGEHPHQGMKCLDCPECVAPSVLPGEKP